MTDRHIGYIVTLAEDLRSDDAEQTIIALKQIKGVVSVTPIVGDASSAMMLERARMDLRQKLWSALKDDYDLYLSR